MMKREFTSVMSGNVPYGAIGSKLGVQPTGFFF